MAKPPRRAPQHTPPLTVEQILAWADAEYKRLGRWPRVLDVPLHFNPNETWKRIDEALRRGLRGLPGGVSLLQMLSKKRGARNKKDLPELTEDQILQWADRYYARVGSWPKCQSGPVTEAPGEKWNRIDMALRHGSRGLPGQSSLSQLLAGQRGARNHLKPPRLSERQIIRWAKAHHERLGRWPGHLSGPVVDVPGETWSAIHLALLHGTRGLPGRETLRQFLIRRCRGRNMRSIPLTTQKILAWADAHKSRTGEWPRRLSGPVLDAPGETWVAIDFALRTRGRGLRTRMTLRQLLTRHRQVP